MLLEVRNLEVVYQDVILALKGISFQVPERGLVALLGANGAGKSTTLRAISGLLDVQNGRIISGNVHMEGEDVTGAKAKEMVRRGIGQVPEGRRIFQRLTIEENLKLGAAARPYGQNVRQDMESVYGHFPVLSARKSRIAGYLSGGEQQMLAIGRGLMSRPKLLLIDELSLGLAPMIVHNLFVILGKINHEKATAILLVEQNAQLALVFTSYGYILENGLIGLNGPSSDLINDPSVKEFYLGMSEASLKMTYTEMKYHKPRQRWVY